MSKNDVDKYKRELISSKIPMNKRIHISIDPRIELLSIVLKLSGYGDLYNERISNSTSSYLNDVENYFNKYSEHDTIKFFRKINSNISGDLPITIVLYLSEPPLLELLTPFDDMVRARAGGEDILKQYTDVLRKFAKETNFTDFYSAHKNFYDSIAEAPKNSIQNSDYIKALEDYYGSQQRSYNVILAPLLTSVAFGPRVHRGNGDMETYCVFPSVGVKDDIIIFKDDQAIRATILHEFGHSFVNPLVDHYKKELSNYAFLMRHVKYNTGANYGTEWNICIYEHVVRAVTTMLTYREFGKYNGKQEMEAHEKQGFIFIKEICNKLKEYENNRNTYPSFRDFFPQLICVFKDLSTKTGKYRYHIDAQHSETVLCSDRNR